MDGMTMNNACMYDEVEEIRNLNRVEGFDPRRYMRLIQKEGQAGKYYLDVAYRKLWFRLRYPEGKIVKKILKLTEQVAIVEARVYLTAMTMRTTSSPMRWHRNTCLRTASSGTSSWNWRRRLQWEGHYRMQDSGCSLPTGKGTWTRK